LHRARDLGDAAVAPADDVTLLISWLRHDNLALAAPCQAERCALYDFVVAELKIRVPLCPHRIGPICRQLENQQDDLLAFARVLDEELERLAGEFRLPTELAGWVLDTIGTTTASCGAGPSMRPYKSDFGVGSTTSRLRWLSWPPRQSGLARWSRT
jgi:hypothetical protein